MTTVEAPPPVPPEPPGYIKVPHPEGLEYADLLAIFTDKAAPSIIEIEKCDAQFLELNQKAQNREEISEGTRELVQLDPVAYHWCFYGKMMLLEEQLKKLAYLDERQKLILDFYIFLTPVAHAFKIDYSDSRYLRWAVTRYRQLSHFVFYRKMDVGPEMANELAGVYNPFANLRPYTADTKTILEKYGIIKEKVQEREVASAPDSAFFPSTEPSPKTIMSPSPTPSATPNETPTPSPSSEETAVPETPVMPLQARPAESDSIPELDDLN